MNTVSAIILSVLLSSLIISCTDNQESTLVKVKKVIKQNENEVPYTTPAVRGAPRLQNESVESNNMVEKAAKVTGVGDSSDVPYTVSVVRGEISLPDNESEQS